MNREEQLQRAVVQRITCDLPFPPSVNNLYVNRQAGGRHPSKRYASWLRVAETEIMAQRAGWPVRTISGPVEVQIQLGRPDRRRRDLDNLSKAILDATVKMGLIDDDSAVSRLTLEWSDEIEGAHVNIYPKGEEPARVRVAAE